MGKKKKGKKKGKKGGKKGKGSKKEEPWAPLTHLHEPEPEFSKIKYGFDQAGGFEKGLEEKPAHEAPLVYRRAAFISPASAETTEGKPRSLAASATLHSQLSDHTSRAATGSYQAFLRRRKFRFAGDTVEDEDGEIPRLFPGVDFDDCDELPENLRSPLPPSILANMRRLEEEALNPKKKDEDEDGGGDDGGGKGKKK